MNVRVKFLGAAGEVTGSKYLLQIGDFNLLLDCGLFQGRKQLQNLNWTNFPVDPVTIDAVVLTHAHLDHTGYLPRLFRQGYRGPVYCTSATADLMDLILMDSARIQVEEARYAKKKGYSEHLDPQPLYTPDDVARIRDYVETTTFEKPVRISESISATFLNAGHILGAAIVELLIRGEHGSKKIVFSGDLGRNNDPILYPPKQVTEADILFVESTYGNRVNTATPRDEILEMMNATFERDGNLVIPAFAIGRTQNLLMYIKNIMFSKEIPNVNVVVDSPMSISATQFYRKHQEYHKLRGIDLDEDESFMNLRKYLTVVESAEESRKINEMKKDTIIIASSGMMTGGRVLHHLINRLPDPDNVIMISGYQAAGSRGRLLQDGEETIRIYGKDIPVRAKIFKINGLSGHADRNELLQWLNGFKHPPAQTFVVHGERESAGALCETLKTKGWNAHIPHYLETVELFK